MCIRDIGWVSTANLQGKFYTYALFDECGRVFYIGKGKGSRLNNHTKPSLLSQNSYKNNKIKKILKAQGYLRREILTVHEKEIDSLRMEEYLITSFGVYTEGGLLCNEHKSHWDISDKVREKLKSVVKQRREKTCPDSLVIELFGYWNKGLINISEAAEISGLKEKSIFNIFRGRKRKHLNLQQKGNVTSRTTVSDETILDFYYKYHNSEITIEDISTETGLKVKTIMEIFSGRSRPHLGIKSLNSLPCKRIEDQTKNLVKSLRLSGKTYGEIVKIVGISKTSVARIVKQEVGTSGTGTSRTASRRDTSASNMEN